MKNKIKKYLSGIFLAILGSLIYSRVIDPNLDVTLNFLGNLFGKISTNYVDSLYSNVGNGVKEVFSYQTYAFIHIVILFVVFTSIIVSFSIVKKVFSLFNEKKKNLENVEAKKEKPKKFYSTRFIKYSSVFSIFLSIGLFLFTLSQVIQQHYTYNLIIYSEKSMDIVAPFVNEQSRLEIKAQYRQVDSYETFQGFNKTLTEIANTNKTTLPKFKFILK